MFILGLVLTIAGVVLLAGGVLFLLGIVTFLSAGVELVGWICVFTGVIVFVVGLLVALFKKSDIAHVRIDKFKKSNLFPLIVMLVIIIIFFQFASPGFRYLKVVNVRNILSTMVLYTLLSVAVGPLIIFGEIDLSPGYAGAVPGIMLAVILSKGGGPWYLVVILCLLTGIAFGLLNAVLVNELRIQSFIATLATGSFVASGLT